MLSRREFLKIGVTASCVLTSTRVLDRQVFAQTQAATRYHALRTIDAVFIAALTPAVLKGALPSDSALRADAINEVVAAFDRTVAGLTPAIQKEVGDLLSLLTFAPTRWLAAGVSTPWEQASEADVTAFVNRWRESRIALFQQGYQALVRVMVACWYGNPLAWQQIGYPGPPQREALGA